MSLVRFVFILTLLVWMVGQAHGQPAPSEAWLSVRTVKADGTPFPSSLNIYVFKVTEEARVAEGRVLTYRESTISVIGLTPGPHEALLVFQGYGVVDGPRAFHLVPGANCLDWPVTPFIPAGGALLSGGKPTTVAAARCQAFLMTVGKSGPLPTSCSMPAGKYRLSGVLPGTYRLLILSNLGYGSAEFEVKPDQTVVEAPVTLRPAAEITLDMTNVDKVTPPYASITFTGEALPGFNTSLTLYTDATGKVGTIMLSPGQWKWSTYCSGYRSATGSLTVVGGQPQTLPIALVKW